jgi:acetoacetyl-CoA reductase
MMKNKLALVTGGVGGIGTAISKCLAADGYTVVANYVVPGSEQTWLDAMREAGFHSVHVAPGDVADFHSVGRMVNDIESASGPIDVLVNCAGITRDGLFRKMSKDDWDAVIGVNLTSAFNVTRHLIDGMIERQWGRIINISSVNGQKGQFGQTNYSAAKAGLHGFTKALAQEVIKYGITVNSISPGYVATDLVMAMRSDVREKIVSQIPAGRLALPEEIGHMVAYLASDRAAFITGANISINGGQHMF